MPSVFFQLKIEKLMMMIDDASICGWCTDEFVRVPSLCSVGAANSYDFMKAYRTVWYINVIHDLVKHVYELGFLLNRIAAFVTVTYFSIVVV